MKPKVETPAEYLARCGAELVAAGRRIANTAARIAEDKTVFLVVQQGGSSGEYYPSMYNRESYARAAMRGHKKDSYSSLGPFPVKLTKTAEGFWAVRELDVIDLLSTVLGQV